uniref:Pentatricopeptide repeat-containing protein-mitochondrial domain-containing protein n=1 Tax=Chenopodium quinoa TaxID=63459 RepID=A0A803LPK4_CHEQI
VCLCISRIQSIRSDFFGISPKLRLNSRRKCKRLRFHTTQVPVASLNSVPILAVIVAAMTVSAVAVVFSNFYYSKRRKVPSSEYNQKEKGTRKVGFYSPKDAAHLQMGSLKEINFPSPGESISEDNVGRVNLSWKGSSSIPEDTTAIGQTDFADSKFQEIGAVASALMEKREIDLPLPHTSSQHLQIESVKEPSYSLSEVKETNINDNEGGTELSNQDHVATPKDIPDAESADFLDSSFHDLGAIASALSVKSEEIGLSLIEESSEYFDVESFEDKNSSLSEVVETTLKENEGRINLSYEDPSLTPLKTSDAESADFLDSNFQNVGAIASVLSEKIVEIGLSVPEASPESLQPPVNLTEESDSVSCGVETDLNLNSPVNVDEMKDTVIALVDTTFTKDRNLIEQNRDQDDFKHQKSSNQERTRSVRDELYMFYENSIASDNPKHLLGINGSSTQASHLVKNNFPVTTRNSAPNMLQEDFFQAAGIRGHGPVASHAGGSFNEGKGLRKVKRSLRKETRARSLLYDHRSVSDSPDATSPEANSQHTIPKHMRSYNRLLKSGRQKAVKEAFRFTMLIPNPTLSTFNMLMSVCAASQDSEGAFDAWLLVQKAGYKADCRLYTTLISTCAKSGNVDTMFEVFHEMVNAGVEPNLHTYGALIDGCARAGQVAKAFGVYGILRSKNVKPDRVVFNALITACGQSKAVERAFDVLAEMRSELQPIDPDHFTIGALIRACTSAGQVDRVKEVYAMMEQFDIKGSPELYTIAANSCSQTGDWDFACNIYADMKRKGVVPDEMFFSALIDVAGHAGNLDAAFEVLQDARTEGMNPGIIAYSSLMGACSNACGGFCNKIDPGIVHAGDADQMQKALDVLTEMQKLNLRPNNITYSILIAASEKMDNLEVGLALFSQAKADGVSFSHIMCKCLIKMCYRRYERASTIGEPVLSFKSGRPQIDSKWASLALMIYREMIGSGLVPSMDILSQVLGCLQLPKDVSLKKRLIETLGINAETSRSASLFPLIDGFAEYDPRSFSLFEEAASLGIVPGASFKESPIVIDATDLNIHVAEIEIAFDCLSYHENYLYGGLKVYGLVKQLELYLGDYGYHIKDLNRVAKSKSMDLL